MLNPPPFDPREFVALARDLSKNSPLAERHLRSAVGRAYCGVFLIARDRLRVTVTENVHHEVIVALRARNRGWADQLARLRRIRVAADYELTPDDPTRRDWTRNWQDADLLAK